LRKVRPEIYSRIDNRFYDEQSAGWWRADSFLCQSQLFLNPARIGYARRALFETLGLDPAGKLALEVGCGGGHLLEEIARMGFLAVGIDPSAGSLGAAKRHSRAAGSDAGYARAIGESLPFRDGTFDAIFCCDVLEHVRDLPRAISEISRVLKPGGAFVYDTLNRTWLGKLAAIRIAQEWKRWAFMPPRLHVWDMFIKPREMKALLRTNGLEWRDHRGAVPSVPPLKALAYLRRRAKGEWTYAELGERIHLVESRIKAVIYLGYAVKY